MDWQPSGLRDKSILFHIVAVAVIGLAVLFSGQALSGKLSFVPTKIFYFPGDLFDRGLKILTDAAHNNAELNAELIALATRLQLTDNALEENRRLRVLLGFEPPAGYRLLPAEISFVFGSGIPNTVRINRGEADSVRLNQTVVTRNGVAGRIGQVYSDHSIVYLLTEPRCRVAARLKRSRELGIIRYNIDRGMYLDNLPRQGDVLVGDTIIASGLGGYFSEGLIIGTVLSAEAPEREVFYDIDVAAAVNFNGLDELYILVLTAPAQPSPSPDREND